MRFIKVLHDAPTGDRMEDYAVAVTELFTDQGFDVTELENEAVMNDGEVPVTILDAVKEESSLRIICFSFIPTPSSIESILDKGMGRNSDGSTVVFVPEDRSSVDDSIERVIAKYDASISFFKPEEDEEVVDVPENVPSSYEIIGTVAIVSAEGFDNPENVSAGIMDQNPNVETVIRKTGQLSGEFRVGEYEIMAGDETETVHKEHGCRYRVDPTKVYFSERLSHERERIGSLVEDGEYMQVWFAGVGPYAVIAARNRSPARVDAIEKNPEGCKFLNQNISLNNVNDTVNGCCGDVREIVPDLPRPDRIVMPLPKSADSFLDLAFNQIDDGGMIHYYRFSADDERWKQPEEEVAAVAETVGRGYEIENRVVCGHYAPYMHRVCLDIRVS